MSDYVTVSVDDKNAIGRVRDWIDQVVIAHNFCPFAARAFNQEKIKYEVTRSTELSALLTDFSSAMDDLLSDSKIETTLIILMESGSDFPSYLEIADHAQTLLELKNLQGVLQIATFHPDYCFADAESSAKSNFTNRAPLPILHLLREASVSAVIDSFPNVDEVPQKNIDYLEMLSDAEFAQLRKWCLRHEGQV